MHLRPGYRGVLSFNQVILYRGPRPLLNGVTFTVFAAQKVGVVGANGAGKTSLLALARGALQADGGEVQLAGGVEIAHVAQEAEATDGAAIDYVIDGDRELRTVQAALEAAAGREDGHHLAELHARMEAIDGYRAQARAARLMHGLGFADSQQRAPVRALSGGWRMRLNLARALMCRSDLLLLDEPTNHLDLDAVIWLEDWLRAYPGTLLLVTHDREFLDRVVDHVVHLAGGLARSYAGNFSAFERQRGEELAQNQAVHAKQQREIARMRAFVDRFRYKASKARQAQSRLKALARMPQIATAHVDAPFHFRFRQPAHLPHPLLRIEDATVGYGAQPVLEDVNLELMPGQRVGLLGANGAGKSTLVKVLAGELGLEAGRREVARNLAVGYFAQHQLEQLVLGDTPMAHLRRLAPEAREQDLRDFLGGFGYGRDHAELPVAHLSGGEKARLTLALLLHQRPNLLLLDEPANHLDLDMRHALSVALQDYPGAMVVVSHDRHLLRVIADELWLVAGAGVASFEGDLDDYARWLRGRNRTPAPEPDRPEPRAGASDRRRRAAAERLRLQPLKREVERLEAEHGRLSREKSALDQSLADPALYERGDQDRLRSLTSEQRRLTRALQDTEARWLAAAQALEQAAAQ